MTFSFRKDGNVVSERALINFLIKTPKYASAAATGIAAGMISTGIGVFAGLSIVATTAIIEKILSDKKTDDEIRITPQKLEKYIFASIQEYEEKIAKCKKQIIALKKEELENEQRVNELNESLQKIRLLSDSATEDTTH